MMKHARTALLLLGLCCIALAAAQDMAPMTGTPGGFSCDPSLENSPEVASAVSLAAKDFMAQAGPSTDALPTCSDYTTSLTQACSQVVAGTNYKLTFQIQCPGSPAYTVQATVFQPLPSSNEMPKVTELATAGLASAPRVVDPTTGTSAPADPVIAGGYTCDASLVNDTDIQQFAELAAEQYVAMAANSSDMPVCNDYVVELSDVCMQVVAGMNYKLTFTLSCPSLDNYVSPTVEAVVYQPLPTSNDPPQVTSLATSGSPVYADPNQGAVAGGYSCDPALALDPEVVSLLHLAAQTYADSANGEAFSFCDGFFAQLLQACTQVVAGMNYKLQFNMTCPSDPSIQPVVINSRVYVPLPNTNEPPQVMELVPASSRK